MYNNSKKVNAVYNDGLTISKIMHMSQCVYNSEYDNYISGTMPLTLTTSVGKPLVDWSMVGNTVQDGTPSPENVVDVLGTGDKTGNLFDIPNITHERTGTWSSITHGNYLCENGTYTLTCDFKQEAEQTTIAVYVRKYGTTEAISSSRSTDMSGKLTITFDVTDNTGFTLIVYSNFSTTSLHNKCTFSNFMTNFGTTALPYEPYGYKIPVVTMGKNLFSPMQEYTIQTYKYFKFTEKDETYTLSVKLKEGKTIPAGLYFGFSENGDYSATNLTKWIIKNGEAQGVYITNESSRGKFKYMAIFRNTFDVNEYFDIQLELGSTPTPYEPYIEPTTTNIYLNSPLMQGETLSSEGEREVEWKKVDMSVLSWRWFESFKSWVTNDITDFIKPQGTENLKGFCTTALCASANTATRTDSYYVFASATSPAVWCKNLSTTEKPTGTLYYAISTTTTETFTPPSIPTQSGTTVIDTDCVVAPSSVTAQYKSSKPDNTLTAMMNILSEV